MTSRHDAATTIRTGGDAPAIARAPLALLGLLLRRP